MAGKITGIKGMEDLHEPRELSAWQLVELSARKIFESAGFQEIRTPIVESADLFERSVGESTEIVQKEMYTLRDRNDKKLALRPEGTASIVRAFIEHYTSHNVNEARFYYMGPMFRYERPQKGRYRQFYQIGAEIFGTDHPLADAEMITLVNELFSKLKLDDIELQLNSLGSRECRNKYTVALKEFIASMKKDLDPEVLERVEKNPLRILDSKDPDVLQALEEAPSILDYLSSETQAHFEQVQSALQEAKVNFTVNPRMVRGLDYYEHTVFEFISGGLGAQNAVAGGGRYNDLVGDLGGPKIPATGFALGMERLVSILPFEKLAPEKALRIYLVGLDETANRELFSQMKELREVVVVELDLGGSSLKGKMKRAARWGADFTVISGEEERGKGILIFRNMKDSSQEEIPADDLFSKILSKLPTQHFLGT